MRGRYASSKGETQKLHLIINGLLTAIPTRAQLLAFLTELPALLGMKAITEPRVILWPQNIAGYVIIAESHISVHIVGDRVFLDIFSCKPFDVAQAELEVVKRLPMQAYESALLNRPLPPIPFFPTVLAPASRWLSGLAPEL